MFAYKIRSLYRDTFWFAFAETLRGSGLPSISSFPPSFLKAPIWPL